MATSNNDNDDISCPICLDTFTIPRSLPCGHSFCHACLNNHINKTVKCASFKCPICRKSTIVRIKTAKQEGMDEMAEQFPVNFSLVKIVDAMEKLQAQNKKTKMKSQLEKLDELFRMTEEKCDQQCEHQLRQLDVVVTQVSEDIDKTAEETIERFTSAVRSQQKILHRQLVTFYQSSQRSIQEKLEQTKFLVTGQKESLGLIDQMTSDATASVSDIKKKIKLAKNTLQYFDTLLDDVSSSTITFQKTSNGRGISPKFGVVTLTEQFTLSSLLSKE